MAYDNEQNEYPLPANGNNERKSESLLPRYFRTEANKKFLQSTLDQIIQPGVAEKLNGYYGRQISKAFKSTDSYIGDISKAREDYQFEPATIIKDDLDNVVFYKDYNDYINQIKNFGGNVDNHDVLNRQEYYAWNPNIDWDKFVNFREYYWLPYGPKTVRISGQSRSVTSTNKVSLFDNLDNKAYVFSSDELVQNPTLIVYRGQTYTFEINTPRTPMSIRTARTLDLDFNYDVGVSAQGVEAGKIIFEVDANAPEVLYYVADNDINISGLIQVRDIEENSEIDVEREIIGKKNYRTEAGFDLSNGMKVRFAGNVTPEIYAQDEWYVEGVGDSIKLIREQDLEIPGPFSENRDIPFDSEAFDRLPFDNAAGFASNKDYIVINRASPDKNPWTRHNRWFHKDIIEKSAQINKSTTDLDQSTRANRPIIEFNSGLKLFQFGTQNKRNVNLVDTFTTDIFSTIEGAIGYNIDGVDLVDGMRILFTAEQDEREAGKIFKVRFINNLGQRQISLIEESDSNPVEDETVLILGGEQFQGKIFYYNGTRWNQAQEKLTVNQQPLFDLFDNDGNSYGDTSVYPASTFIGNKVFSYRVGRGIVDTVLGFPVTYRSIENIGDLVFDFNLLSDSFTYTQLNQTVTQSTNVCVLKKHNNRTQFNYVNAWQKAEASSSQRVLRQYVAQANQQDFPVDVYNNSGTLDDLNVRVTVNNAIKFEGIDYTVENINNQAVIRFIKEVEVNSIVVLRSRSSTTKNANGYYEIPDNLEKNPLNDNVETFTLGEVNDHVSTIVTEAIDFKGEFPGASNLRDIGNVTQYGKKFLQHTGPINLSLYHLTDKNTNIIKSIDYVRREYSKFKRLFLQTALTIGYDGSPKEHVDLIFKELNRDKNINFAFYFSDMAPVTGAKRLTFTVAELGNTFYPLSRPFNLNEPSTKAVMVYVNDIQLLLGTEYTFNDAGFCVITAPLTTGDRIDIYEYDSTDGSYIPPTPTKLGMYPKYRPQIFVDDTYITPTKVIQGHDGSIIKAFDDYRDDLVLELEKRIYNNIKIQYDPQIIDITDFVGGEYRDTQISKASIDNGMIKDFANWLTVIGDVDYTGTDFYDRTNSFTYNYSFMTSPSGIQLPGYWRSVYKQAYDTDRPHVAPWEMLGFSEKPAWWESKYGPSPYTSNNLIMWTDIEGGVIAEPGRSVRISEKFKRPGLLTHLPVNEQGILLSPLDSRYAQNYVNSYTKTAFKFGDEAPVEAAWRRSSELPYSLLKAWTLNQPSKIIGLGFDRYRSIRNAAGQLVYKETGLRIRLKDLVFPNSSQDVVTRVFSAGFINFIADYLASNVLINYNVYKDRLFRITNQLAFKVGGFTDKKKFSLILDSRTPLNEGNVFIPEENYRIILQTSSPIELLTYSGVVVEKSTNGYILRGYDTTNPIFTYFSYLESDTDPLVNIGGISESFINWAPTQRYVKGTIVSYNSVYYRVTEAHTSAATFDITKFSRLPELPKVGGRNAIFRKQFNTNNIQQLAYGSLLKTSQEVVDFLLGYGEYLLSKGFVFDNFNNEIGAVENWKLSAREFLFWTTQNWDPGTLLTVSPAAQKLEFYNSAAVVDNVFDTFYDYSLIKADGTKLRKEFTNISRNIDNRFSISLKNTADGIYAIKLPLVQTEHVIILDNQTEFKDVIYDLEPGYRQERIRVIGYKASNWTGSLSIPGFIYDDAVVTEWTAWRDYAIGDVVKYKEFYYTATKKISGTEVFDSAAWYRLNKKPEPGLLTNLEYKTNQFADFYDLDTDNFDVTQQEIAQHLIGYQKRQYLSNIINDDVSQYKFYQGFIQDKGTRNALTKLFDALSSADKDSLEFYEEWAIRLGQYGASDGFEEVEFLLDEDQFRLSPQPILLTDTIPDNVTDLVYRQLPDGVFLTPQNYNHAPFPTEYQSETVLRTAGYVRESDVQFTVKTKDDILTLDAAQVKEGNYVWVTYENQSWNVYKHIDTPYTITAVELQGDQAELILDKWSNFSVGDIVGIYNIEDLEGFYKITSTILNKVTIALGDTVLQEDVTNAQGIITTFISNRVNDLNDANRYAENTIAPNELIWVDNIENEKWSVIRAESSYNLNTELVNPLTGTNLGYGSSLSADDLGNTVVVGTPDADEGKVFIYTTQEDGSSNGLALLQTLEPVEDFSFGPSKYGASVALSPDARYLIVGAPEASRVKSAYKDNFDVSADYLRTEIVQYNDSLYRARRNVKGTTTNVVFGTHDSASQWRQKLYDLYGDYRDFPIITTGDYPLIDTETDHILVRAPVDAFEGSKPGDAVYFNWNDLSYNYNPLSQIPIVGINMGLPIRFTLGQAHGLLDGDEIVVTDVPNDGLTVINEQYDNSDPAIPRDTVVQQGVKGLEYKKYFVKIIAPNAVEIYFNESLTIPVNGAIGFTGTPILGGAFNGNIRKISKPFNNKQPGIDTDFFVNTVHTIRRKVEEVFYVVDPLNIPNISRGDKVTTPTGDATVVYIKSELGRLVIYANNKNGVFDSSGELFINSTFKIGNYTRPLHEDIDRSTVLGGYWEIATGFTYNPSGLTTDTAHGLVIQDVKNNYNPINFSNPDLSWRESAERLPYKSSLQNVLDNPPVILVGVDRPFLKESDLIRNLSYVSLGIGGGTLSQDVLDTRFVVRMPVNVSDKLVSDIAAGRSPKLGIWLNSIPGPSGQVPNLSNKGFGNNPYSVINRVESPIDVWEGYIDYRITAGTIDLLPGDVVREGLSGATAVVTFYQRDLNKARIYVKNITGEFTFGSRYFNGIPPDSMRLYKIVSNLATEIGITESRQLADSSVGKLAVFQHTSTLPIPPEISLPVNPVFADDISNFKTEYIRGLEYHTWIEEFKPGLPRTPQLPSTANNDWEQVLSIPINTNRSASSFTREGAFFVYERNSETGLYELDNGYILPNREDSRELGRSMRLIKNNNLYKLIINSDESHVNDIVINPGKGRLYFVLNGEDENGTYNWSVGKDKNFKGPYSETTAYFTDQIVIYNGAFYKALTNLQAEVFDTSKWQALKDHVDFVGYLPNTTGNLIDDDTTITDFVTSDYGNVFDISDNGDTLATIAEYPNENILIIYRLNDFHFELVQEVSAPVGSRGFGASVAVSDDGRLIAVGAPNTDAESEYQGRIYVYKNVNGSFILTQTLESPNKEQSESFGFRLGFDGDQLVVTSAKGDIILDTTLDRFSVRDTDSEVKFNSKYVNVPTSPFNSSETTFDAGFTKFSRRVVDSGVVYIYERLKNSLVFGQRLDYTNFDIVNFGKNILVKGKNIYVGMPTLNEDSFVQGKVIIYNKPETSNTWEIYREPIDQISINKFRGSFVYDIKKNDLLARLDILDPISGKVPGIAEQELSYKTYYDPATYNTGTDFNLDKFTSWGNKQVGNLWWDLSTVKYINYYQGDIIYSQSVWNTLAKGSSIDVYEWVESPVSPSDWDTRADTNAGVRQGYSGKSRYGNTRYVVKQIYDKDSQSFTEKYYFWVKGKKIVPAVEGRNRTAQDIENIIRDPQSQSLAFVTILGKDRFVLYNVNNLVKNKDVAVNFRYWTIENQENNIHREYQIITEGLETSRPKKDIEEKWFDSLIGQDRYGRMVPDPALSVKQRYGSLTRPRQSWFVNRKEALKQFIERVNGVLTNQLAIDSLNIDKLFASEPQPSIKTGRYDVTVDTEQELRFIGTVRASTATLSATVVDGTVESVTVLSGGRGYRVAPSITINGTGEDLILEAVINNLGIITEVKVINGGTNYSQTLSLTVRPLTALVKADSEIDGAWALYEFNSQSRQWARATQQSYNVTKYWKYKDWYADGYSQLTSVDFLIDDFYQLNITRDNINDITKIENVGSGGWILVQKIVNVDTPDYTINYRTVGRQNGTIEFLPTLFTEIDNEKELRIILEAIRNELFVNELANEYNNLFFSSLRYVFSEQNYVDWAFKTSFVKAKHNVGTLDQKTTFQNDNLPSYEEYIKEVKPYKTSIREYISSYETIENTDTSVTDFGLSPVYNPATGIIESPHVTVQDGILTNANFDIAKFPDRYWADNYTFYVEKIEIEDGGSGFSRAPTVSIFGGGGTGAKARAFISNGEIKQFVITDPGSGYTSAPSILIEGTQNVGGRLPKLSVIIKNDKVRQFTIKQKFDRVSPKFDITDLRVTEEFISSGTELRLVLKWPMNLAKANITVFFNDVDALTSQYSYTNEKDVTAEYTRFNGVIELAQALPQGVVIRVEYLKSPELLTASDRVNLLYNPAAGQYGKDLGQVMDGVDYGGVEVRSFEFGLDLGWDAQPWYTSNWDSYDENFEDETFITDGSTSVFQLSKPFEAGVNYNIYINGIRIDDPNYDGSTKTYIADDGSTVLALGNPNAIMKTVTSTSTNYTSQINDEGVTEYFVTIDNIEEFEEYYTNSAFNPPTDQVVVIRKSTSDGSFLPQGNSLDSIIQGGNLVYGTATGLKAEDITIDGDGFVTPTTSKGPEELVPGQLLDTVDIRVYDRAGDGGSLMAVRNYIATPTLNKIFELTVLPHNIEALLLKVNGVILNKDQYQIDLVNKTVILNSSVDDGARISIVSMSGNGEQILDIDNFIGDGETQTFVTNVGFQEGVTAYVTINGVNAEVEVFETDSSYGKNQGLIGLRFVVAPATGQYIYYAIYKSTEKTYSEVAVDRFEGDGSTVAFELSREPFTRAPLSHNVIVKVGNKILYPGYTQHFFITAGREYPLTSSQFGPSTLSANQVDVYINGEKLVLLQDYRWDFANTQVILFDNVGTLGDNLDITVLNSGEYAFTQNTQINIANVTGIFETGETVIIGSEDSTSFTATVKSYINNQLVVIGAIPQLVDLIDNDNTIGVIGQRSGAVSNIIIGVTLIEAGDNLILSTAPELGQTVEVFKFSEHNAQDINMETKLNTSVVQLIVGTDDYFNYRRLTNGLIKLRKTAVDEAYVWVSLNGELLTANVDYKLAKMNNYIQITRPLKQGDAVQVIHFAADKTNEKFGFRIFKDMLNRTHYKRLNKDKVYVLAEPLSITDTQIHLVSATGITEPNKSLNIPGILFIEGERIEYFEVEDNVLSQLRRGTLGTGPKDVYEAGTELMDQSLSETIPYQDEHISLIKVDDESTRIVLDWTPNPTKGVNEFEVFVGGKRLRKNAIQVFDSSIDQDSPEADVTIPPDYTLENGNIVVLANKAPANSRVLIVRKVGKLWQLAGEQLRYSTNSIAEFIRGATTDLPK
jgi:hypothetical protein